MEEKKKLANTTILNHKINLLLAKQCQITNVLLKV